MMVFYDSLNIMILFELADHNFAPYFVTEHVGHGSKSMQFAFLSFNYRMAIFGSKGIRELGFVLDNLTRPDCFTG